MATGTDILKVTNKVYLANIARWQLNKAAFLGGDDWKTQQLLYKYRAEETTDYDIRIKQTPLENHCESVLSTYAGFIWRDPPKRNFGTLVNNYNLNRLIVDADMDGTSLNEFMKTVQILGGVYGVVWIVMDKPSVTVVTRADEISGDIRPYMRLYTPEDVIDFEFSVSPNGSTHLSYLKTKTENTTRAGLSVTVIEWTDTNIVTTTLLDGDVIDYESKPNPIKIIPAVLYSNQKSTQRGNAPSDIEDIVGMQVSIYNDYSELTQMIRGSNHKTLVKNRGDEATTGAGGVIIMDADAPSNKNPYLLQADAEALAGLLSAISTKIEAINRMSHLTPVRSYRSQVSSAVAMETEFQILNTLLAGKSAQLQLCENQLFRVFCAWEGVGVESAGYEVIYPMRFELRDRKSDLDFLVSARATAEKTNSATLIRAIDKELARVSLSDDTTIEAIDKELSKKTKVVVAPAPAA
jgi:hypothetical protein